MSAALQAPLRRSRPPRRFTQPQGDAAAVHAAAASIALVNAHPELWPLLNAATLEGGVEWVPMLATLRRAAREIG